MDTLKNLDTDVFHNILNTTIVGTEGQKNRQ